MSVCSFINTSGVLGELKYVRYIFLIIPSRTVVFPIKNVGKGTIKHKIIVVSIGDEFNGVRHMEIENLRDSFTPPDVLLADFLGDTR